MDLKVLTTGLLTSNLRHGHCLPELPTLPSEEERILLGCVRSCAAQSFVGEVVSILVAWSFAAKSFVGKVVSILEEI